MRSGHARPRSPSPLALAATPLEQVVEPIDMFPQDGHIEIVTTLMRESKQSLRTQFDVISGIPVPGGERLQRCPDMISEVEISPVAQKPWRGSCRATTGYATKRRRLRVLARILRAGSSPWPKTASPATIRAYMISVQQLGQASLKRTACRSWVANITREHVEGVHQQHPSNARLRALHGGATADALSGHSRLFTYAWRKRRDHEAPGWRKMKPPSISRGRRRLPCCPTCARCPSLPLKARDGRSFDQRRATPRSCAPSSTRDAPFRAGLSV